MSDLVEPLRESARFKSDRLKVILEETCEWKAADEIERLREALQSIINTECPVLVGSKTDQHPRHIASKALNND